GAVQHSHQKGIIHRDIKPSNILVTLRDGKPVPKIIDFGIAKATHSELTTKTLFTAHRQLVGTPAYMAPEQWSGQMADARSDQFSYCVALWEALYGQRPFAGDNAAAIAFSVTAGTLREPRSPRRVPSWMRTILARGLEVSPERRWPSMLALLDAFEHAQLRRRRRKWLLGL
ncbi:MAG: serine/threonine protein kinase, partial [Planctomycetes bacterium]|nr:serine/threonine protein kinase [Planctomycetota bacterium]